MDASLAECHELGRQCDDLLQRGRPGVQHGQAEASPRRRLRRAVDGCGASPVLSPSSRPSPASPSPPGLPCAYCSPTLCLLCHPSHSPIQPPPPSHSSHPLPPTIHAPSLTPPFLVPPSLPILHEPVLFHPHPRAVPHLVRQHVAALGVPLPLRRQDGPVEG